MSDNYLGRPAKIVDANQNLFRHRKTHYRGLAKNTAQLFTLFGFANLVLAGRRFAITETRSAS